MGVMIDDHLGTKITTKEFNMRDVRSHTLDISPVSVFFKMQFVIALPVWLGVVLVLYYKVVGESVADHPLLFWGGTVASLVAVLWLFYGFAELTAMEEHALRERNMTKQSRPKLHVVKEDGWDRFVRGLSSKKN